jgi:ABC-type sugar transport system substrate-binding protein
MVARTLAILGLVLSLSVFVAACGSDDSDTTGGGGGDTATTGGSGGGALDGATIYNNQYTPEVQYFQDKAEGLDARAAEVGATVENEYGNATPEEQISQVETALTRQPTAMAVVPMDGKSLEPVLRMAQEQDIPSFVVGASIDDLSLVDAFVGAPNERNGEEKAEFVVEQLGGKGTVGMINGIKGQSFTEEQIVGYEAVLSKEPGITVVDGGYAGGFASDLGLERTENLLTRAPDIDAILYGADDLTLGGLQAIKQRGIAKDDIVIASTDGASVALEAVEAGEIDYTLSLCGYAQGIQLLDLMGEALEGVELESEIESKTLAYTTENIAELQKKPRSFCS